MKPLALILLLSLLHASPVWAGWDEAKSAYDRGDYETAAREYRALAEEGDTWAQNNLGLMYYLGQGVPRDLVRAHLWLSLAVARLVPGEDRNIALRNRDAVIAIMTPEQVAEAERLAHAWKPKSPQ